MGEITFNDPVKFDTSMDAIKPRRRENLWKINSTTRLHTNPKKHQINMSIYSPGRILLKESPACPLEAIYLNM